MESVAEASMRFKKKKPQSGGVAVVGLGGLAASLTPATLFCSCVREGRGQKRDRMGLIALRQHTTHTTHTLLYDVIFN